MSKSRLLELNYSSGDGSGQDDHNEHGTKFRKKKKRIKSKMSV